MTDDDSQADQPTTNKQPKVCKKTTDAIQMVMAGIDPAEALKYVNFKDKISAQAIYELKQKVKKHSLTEPTTVKLASGQIKRILRARARTEARKKVTNQGEVIEYTEEVYPTDSNILAAAGMVYDRYEPLRGKDAGTQTNNTYIDLSSYQLSMGVNLGVSKDVTKNNDNDNK